MERKNERNEGRKCLTFNTVACSLSICRPNIELKAMEHLLAQHLVAVVPKSKPLIDCAEFWPTSRAIQSKKLATMLARELARVAKENLGKVTALLARTYGKLVNECGRPIGNFRPEEPVVQLESEYPERAFVVKRCIVHARANMRFDTRLAYLHQIPERLTLQGQIGCGGTQHVGNEAAFIGPNLANVHC